MACRGTAIRPAWFAVHWLFGTAAIILGWFNIFKGLDEYVGNWPSGGERKVSRLREFHFLQQVCNIITSFYSYYHNYCLHHSESDGTHVNLWHAGIVRVVGCQRCNPSLSVPLVREAAIHTISGKGSKFRQKCYCRGAHLL